ncbi:hypothetical protein B0T21DRAFT_59525 [Apiosordaria backusii]|uniref:Uncharacterized protein n=1 Tax=Apiosordaria backusii TaxID=314023 RepID=A0AA40ANA5_9PEZI|nr:hypothetical protein B0T21DRAFT_59525 [Apiosordaria backusii]
MAANETTPLLGGNDEDRNTAAPTVADANPETDQSANQPTFQSPGELKVAVLAHLNSVIDSLVAVGLGLVYGPFARDPPKYYYPPYRVQDLAQASVTVGIITIVWGLANLLLFYYRRRLLGPAFLNFLIHGLGAAITIPLVFVVLGDLMSESGHRCQYRDREQYYPADPRCLAWVDRFHTLVYTGLLFFLGVGISHAALAYVYFVCTWRQFVSFIRSLPWSRPEVSAQNGDYRARVPVPIVPLGGVSFEFGIKFYGREFPPRLNTGTEANTSGQAS